MSSTSSSRRSSSAPHSAHASGSVSSTVSVAVRAVPDRELVAPPELARDAPVGRVLERVDREPVLRLGVEAHAPLAQRGERRLLQLVHRAPPLERDQRLDPALAALAERDRVPVGLALLEQAALAAPGEDPLLGLLLREARRARGRCRSCARRARSPSARGAPWSRPISKSSGSWPGVTLSAPVPNSGSTRSSAITSTRRSTNGTTTSLPTSVPVALVVRVHGDGDVGQDRRRPRGRDRDVAGAVDERVADRRERVVDLDVDELEVGERGLVERAPVDDPVGPVDPALAVEVDEEAHDRARRSPSSIVNRSRR